MDWIFEQIFEGATALLLALAGSALISLCVFVWRKAPKEGKLAGRLWVGVRQTKFLSASLIAVVGICLGVVVVGWVSNLQTKAEAAPAELPRTSQTTAPAAPSLDKAGWGPARDLVKYDSRPANATINSMIDRPKHGDERNFTFIRRADDENAAYKKSVVAVPGKVYEVLVLVNNDAVDGGESAQDVRLRMQMPGVAKGSAPAHAFVSSSNTTPREIWDGVTLVGERASEEFALRYVSDSAMFYSGGSTDGTSLSDDFFKDGVQIGCDSMDGLIPAGDRCRSWVIFKVRIDQPNFSVKALADLDDNGSWSETVVAAPGQVLRIAVSYQNTGTNQQDDVVLRVDLPDNMHFVQGSTYWSNASHHDVHTSDDAIKDVGINLGSYAPTGNVWAVFEVKVDGPLDESTNTQVIEKFFTASTNAGDKFAPLTLIWF